MKTSKNKANVISNLSFVLVDVLESAFMEVNELLKAENNEFKHEVKREFNLLLRHCRNLKKYIRTCSIETQEYYGQDADIMYQTIKLLLDRSGEDEMKFFEFFNYIKSFPSQLNMNIDDSVFSEIK